MPDEAADRPADAGAEPSQDAAAPTAPIPTPPTARQPAPPSYGAAPVGDEASPPAAPLAPGATHHGTTHHGTTHQGAGHHGSTQHGAGHDGPGAAPGSGPGAGPGPGAGGPPPWFGAGAADGSPYFSRQGLIRPTQGRYLAGVCAAIGRATNTDPVLWRVVLAVLTIFGGIGLLIYLIGWLIIPGEGDTASPVESLLGRGRSHMSPITVLILGAAVAITFAFIVDNGFRATLLAAIVVGGVLLYRRDNAAAGGAPAAFQQPPSGPFPQAAGGSFAQAAGGPPAGSQGTGAYLAPSAATTAVDEPVTAPLPPIVPPTSSFAPPPPPPPPPGGYRPPFAPHGPYAAGSQAWRTAPPPPPKPPKPVRQRSKLGRITFFLVLVTIGLVALLDLGGVDVQTSTYFAAALATIALGLIVGAWFGRARGLIALALLVSIGLGISSATERLGVDGVSDPVTWQPTTVAGIADRYETPVGEVTLDLRQVDFTGQNQKTSIVMHVGKLTVLLPPTVDTTSVVDVDFGSTTVFGQVADGADLSTREVTDLGPDGAGGGTLRLDIRLDMGDVEVTR